MPQVIPADATPAAPDFLAQLNPRQQQAALAPDQNLLVLAGPGSGKTRTLVARIAHLVHSGRAQPHEILAVTFTNKASQEIKQRIQLSLPNLVNPKWPWLGTFHSIGARILRQTAHLLDMTPDFSILDADDQKRLIKEILDDLSVDHKQFKPALFADVIDSWKNQALDPKDVPADDAHLVNGHAVNVYHQLQIRMRNNNYADFGDLLLLPLRILQRSSEIRSRLQRRIKYVLVDEYQDSNAVQRLWLQNLVKPTPQTPKPIPVCCVGDDDQSIYGWRGADVQNLLQFPSHFPDPVIVRLEQNYRSSGHIVAAAAKLIGANNVRHKKSLRTDAPHGKKIHVQCVFDHYDEARFVSYIVESFRHQNVPLHDVAVLVRNSHQMRPIETQLVEADLPYRITGGPKFYERAEIRDANAYLRIAANNDDVALQRIINTPARGIGPAAVVSIRRLAAELKLSLCETILSSTSLSKPLQSFALLLSQWRKNSSSMRHEDLLNNILNTSGYVDHLKNLTAKNDPSAQTRLENLKELQRAMEPWDNLQAWLEHVALATDGDNPNNSQNHLNLMTLHAAKGLEFHSVILPGWEEGLLPSQYAVNDGSQHAIEEERRLAYVGLTRAKQYAHVLFAKRRSVFSQWRDAFPSRFLSELHADHIHTVHPNAFLSHRPPASSPFKINHPSQTPRIPLGARVSHSRFGEGVVLHIDGEALRVAFDDHQEKTIVASYLKAL